MIHLQKQTLSGGMVRMACVASPFTKGRVLSKEDFGKILDDSSKVICKKCLAIYQNLKEASVSDLGQQPTPSLGLVKIKRKKKMKTLAQEVLDLCELSQRQHMAGQVVLKKVDVGTAMYTFWEDPEGSRFRLEVANLAELQKLPKQSENKMMALYGHKENQIQIGAEKISVPAWAVYDKQKGFFKEVSK